MDLFAAIDLVDGGAVRLVQGDFRRRRRYGDPLRLAEEFVGGGAPWLHVVDLDAARTGVPQNRRTVIEIAHSVTVPVQTGGGIRTEGDVADLLSSGVARVVIGTAALEDPGLVTRSAAAHPGAVAVALDYRRRGDGSLEPAVRGWRRRSATSVETVLGFVEDAGVAAVMATDIERDGTLSGPDTEGLAQLLDASAVPLVGSGGVGTIQDVRALVALRGPDAGRGLAGVIVGEALADGRLEVKEVAAACARSG